MSVTYPQHDVLQVGELTIQLPNGLVRINEQTLTVSIREFAVLLALARAQGRIISREQLYLEAWGKPMAKRDRSVDVYVHKLRTKLEGAQPGMRFIHTHVGFGYRLDPEQSQDLHNSTTKR
jgi:DNA-binding response OmpR family regulator